MAEHNEIEFEREICEHLAANGWLYSPNDTGYDVERALFPEDVFGWLGESQPEAFEKAVKPGSPDEAKRRTQLLDRLAASLSKPMTTKDGALRTIRKGFKLAGAGQLDMMQARPETGHNATTTRRYAANRLRVMRQVHFGDGGKSIDLVFFLNGVPVATAELKTENTQSFEIAKRQYRERRLVGPNGKPLALLGNGTRALVHFAVSEDEVWMTTKLAEQKTFFLPFNRGTEEHGAGNPVNPSGQKTSYLWEEVLQRDAWLAILSRFMWVKEDRARKTDGRQERRFTLMFPRYHQWDVVEKLGRAVAQPNPQHRFLVQHSAGSGKTNSIAWLAHRLARIHVSDVKLFDTVIVVTDRNVLDDQLQEAVRQIDVDNAAIVATIDDRTVRESDTGSKSGALAQALEQGKLIIVVTIQTFPFILSQIQNAETLRAKRFAIIADEAHSSQSGQTAAKLKNVLTAEQLDVLAEDGEVDVDATQLIDQALSEDMRARADHEGLSFFAFTATPKGKTLDLFGQRDPADPDATPAPFHLYSMKQAIEEEFILDVLQGYRTYRMFTDLREKSAGALDVEVEESRGKAAVKLWVREHSQTIAEKSAIIVEHFRDSVAHLLDGQAKAMVVSPSRVGAVKYKREIDKYIARKGYDYGTLVAFSGTVEEPETEAALGLETLTEGTMNPGVRDLRSEFMAEQYRVMIVANKFQTGFDQPLLCAMYVDKRLSGITAVQTLSRLNRMHTTRSGVRKTAEMTQVIDFVNHPDEIEAAFRPYFTSAEIDRRTDPNLIYDLLEKIDDMGLYEDAAVDQVVTAFYEEGTGTGSRVNTRMSAGLAPAKKRFADQLRAARERDDKLVLDELAQFRKNVHSYVNFFDFISQVVNYEDTDLARKAIFLRLLSANLRDVESNESIDLSGVELTRLQLVAELPVSIDISGGGTVKGTAAVGSAVPKDPVMARLYEIARELSTIIDLPEDSAAGLVMMVQSEVNRDETVARQKSANTERQFMESPDVRTKIIDALLGAGENAAHATDVLLAGDERGNRGLDIITQGVYRDRDRS